MYELDKEKFGAFVAELRKEKGYTQKELARQLFISDKAVSKWETASSIPDTALLIPLANLLGVSVTELLMCRRLPQDDTMKAEQVETLIKTAVSYSEEKQLRAWQTRSSRKLLFLLALLAGGAQMYFLFLNGRSSEDLTVCFFLSALFGFYFCFLAKLRLPAFYDQNRVNIFFDGPVHINMPGLYFNNANWPHILKSLRIWSCLSMVFLPALRMLMDVLLPESWAFGETLKRLVLLFLVLGGMFIPMYAAGRKYENLQA